MADIYFGTGGTSGGAGTEGDPLDTFDNAVNAAGTSDRVVMLSGSSETHPSSFFRIATASDARSCASQGFRDATLLANASHTVRVLYIDSNIGSSEEVIVDGFILDCDDGRVDHGMDASSSEASPGDKVRIQNVEVRESDLAGFEFVNTGNGSTDYEFFNVKCTKVETPCSTGWKTLLVGTNIGDNAEQNVRIQNLEIDLIAGASVEPLLLRSQQNANTVTANIIGYNGTITNTNSSQAVDACQVIGIPNAIISNCDLTIDNDSGASSTAIRVIGESASVDADNAVVVNNRVQFDCQAGYAIEFGGSTTASNMAGGTFSGNTVTGKYYASASPHGLSLGEDTSAEMFGNVVDTSFACYLISRVTSAEVYGNLCINPYGVAFYAKGVKGTTNIRNNVVTLRDSAKQRTRGLIEATFQGVGINCNGANFTNNLIIVQSVDALGATGSLPEGRTDNGRDTGYLATKIDANQVCTFSGNTYVLPDTVDVDTAELFNYEGADYTLSQWNGESDVSDERIILLPQAQINGLIAQYESLAASGEGAGNGSFGIGI